MPKILKYGLEWDDWVHPLEIEFAMIRFGGKFEGFGEGLFQHYKNAETICWPEDDHNRWTDLTLKTILHERLSVICGCRDSSKTRRVGKWALIDYWVFPFETLTLMSSTDVRGLELRVWGDLKDLWDRAHERFDWLAGNVVDSKHAIFTDALDDDNNLRDQRRGVICIPILDSDGNETKTLERFVGIKQKRRRIVADECFPAGTPVLTPHGVVPIESISPGDFVVGAIGTDRVVAVSRRESPELVCVRCRDGREVVCTPNHPFLTNQGWEKAIDLSESHYLISPHEVMRDMSLTAAKCSQTQEVLRHEMLCGVEKGVVDSPTRFEGSSGKPIKIDGIKSRQQSDSEILRSVQCGTSSWGFSSPQVLRPEMFRKMEEDLVDAKPKTQGQHGGSHETGKSNGVAFLSGKSEQDAYRNGLAPCDSWGQWDRTDEGRMAIDENVPGGEVESRNPHWNDSWQRIPDVLQSGLGASRIEACYRGRRKLTPHPEKAFSGSKENPIPCGAWVDRVEILKQDDPRFRKAARGFARCSVHNLQVEGHPSYVVNGFVVHNCQFLSPRYLNVLSNLDKGDFKGVFTGNPLGQMALDKISEPECGWDNMPEPTKTATWRNKFDGVTVNLVGTDSPNFDADRPKDYPYLIDAADVERVKKRFGADSVEFYSQIKGVRKAGMNMRLVLTPEMCRVNGAYDAAIWGHGDITNVLGVDAGYGGDACETVFIQFGEDASGKIVVKFHEPEVIPINLNSDESPEDQIAIGVREKCEGLRVPPGNVAFEAGMRATLAVSFGRIFSGQAEAINAGGPATDRPVSDDLYVDDDESSIGKKRLKRCNEHYSKFITELWFSVRALVEAKMARELPKGVVKEFSEREWIWARGTKYELESKDDFKKRWNYSPNKADATAIAVEKARRLGLVISRQESPGVQVERDDWLEKEMDKHRQFMQKRELIYK